MSRSSQRILRKSWMRRARRAAEGRGYRVVRVKCGAHVDGTDRLKTYILKADGRIVISSKDEKGKLVLRIVKESPR